MEVIVGQVNEKQLNEDYNFFLAPRIKETAWKTKYKMEDNMEIGHQDARGEGLGGMESSGLRWGPRRYPINTVVNRWFPKCKKYFKLSENMLVSHKCL